MSNVKTTKKLTYAEVSALLQGAQERNAVLLSKLEDVQGTAARLEAQLDDASIVARKSFDNANKWQKAFEAERKAVSRLENIVTEEQRHAAYYRSQLDRCLGWIAAKENKHPFDVSGPDRQEGTQEYIRRQGMDIG